MIDPTGIALDVTGEAPIGGVSFAWTRAVTPLVGVELALGAAALGGAAWYVRRRR